MQAVLAAYVHNIDPVIIRFTDTLAVRWYGLSYVAGFIFAWLIFHWFARTKRSPLTTQSVGDLMFYGIIGVLIGGRLGYAIFYQPTLLYTFTQDFPFWQLLAINQGGMASHGGILGVIVAMWLFSRSRQVPALHLLDIGTLAATPGLFLGRIANFINGELWGKPVSDQLSPLWWSIKYPQELHYWLREENPPIDRLRQISEIVPQVQMSITEWNAAVNQIAAQPENPPAEALRLVHYTIDQLVDAAQAGNAAVLEAITPLLSAYYPSQLFQAISDGPVLATILVLIWLRPRKPGVIGGSFLVAYGILRIITEMFRQPDAALVLGLSRGQALSCLMVIAGIVMITLCARREVSAMGGLLRSGS